MVRPSYVLGGRAMERVYDARGLEDYFTRVLGAGAAGGGGGRDESSTVGFPLLIDQFLADAVELDVDVVADQTGAVVVGGVMEHIEEAGIHSGDSACALPPYSLPADLVDEVKRQARVLATELGVVGLMNTQSRPRRRGYASGASRTCRSSCDRQAARQDRGQGHGGP
jgi:carbamoyl-phosphate synthase large subunit